MPAGTGRSRDGNSSNQGIAGRNSTFRIQHGIFCSRSAFLAYCGSDRLLMMTRLLAILMLLGAGGAGLGHDVIGGRSHGGSCGESGCHEVSHCSDSCEDSDEDASCAMSGGECRCSASPSPDRRPGPDAPMLPPGRDSITAYARVTTPDVEHIEAGTHIGLRSAGSFGLLRGRTHNEIQALLGIWRT